ncbi:MAG: ABC transporter substrate-binding protein [Halopseudomonas sp.]
MFGKCGRNLWCRQRLSACLCGWILATNVMAQQQPAADSMTLIAAELPPYAYRSEEQITGLGVELMLELGLRLGHSGAISLMPFKRALQNARSRNAVLMTPVARVASREGTLKWVIHYIDDSFFYVSRAGAPALTHQLARQSGVIGVLAGSAPLAQLKHGGVERYLEQTLDTANINMLKVGRIDGWFTSAILLSAAFKANPELDPNEFVIGPVQSQHCVYMVASVETSDEVLRPWREAFIAMQRDGTVAEVLSRYIDPYLQGLLGAEEGLSTSCEYAQSGAAITSQKQIYQ